MTPQPEIRVEVADGLTAAMVSATVADLGGRGVPEGLVVVADPAAAVTHLREGREGRLVVVGAPVHGADAVVPVPFAPHELADVLRWLA